MKIDNKYVTNNDYLQSSCKLQKDIFLRKEIISIIFYFSQTGSSKSSENDTTIQIHGYQIHRIRIKIELISPL